MAYNQTSNVASSSSVGLRFALGVQRVWHATHARPQAGVPGPLTKSSSLNRIENSASVDAIVPLKRAADASDEQDENVPPAAKRPRTEPPQAPVFKEDKHSTSQLDDDVVRELLDDIESRIVAVELELQELQDAPSKTALVDAAIAGHKVELEELRALKAEQTAPTPVAPLEVQGSLDGHIELPAQPGPGVKLPDVEKPIASGSNVQLNCARDTAMDFADHGDLVDKDEDEAQKCVFLSRV